jgi:hypothetical protein
MRFCFIASAENTKTKQVASSFSIIPGVSKVACAKYFRLTLQSH